MSAAARRRFRKAALLAACAEIRAAAEIVRLEVEAERDRYEALPDAAQASRAAERRQERATDIELNLADLTAAVDGVEEACGKAETEGWG